MRHQNVFLTLAIVADCRRKQGGRNQGGSQLTVWQWLTRVECKLTSRTTNSKQTKKRRQQDISNYSKPQEKAGKVLASYPVSLRGVRRFLSQPLRKESLVHFARVYSGTSLIRTPEMRTPRFNGHFAQIRNLSHSLLYIFTSEMRTPRYSV